jgi:hypothetical protein
MPIYRGDESPAWSSRVFVQGGPEGYASDDGSPLIIIMKMLIEKEDPEVI